MGLMICTCGASDDIQPEGLIIYNPLGIDLFKRKQVIERGADMLNGNCFR